MAKRVKIHPRDGAWGYIVFIIFGITMFIKLGMNDDLNSGVPCVISVFFSLYLLALVFRPYAQIKSPDNLLKQDFIVIGLMVLKFLYTFLLSVDIPMLMLVVDVVILMGGLIYVNKNKSSYIAKKIRLESFCPGCGKPYAEDDMFCRSCGLKRVKL